MGFAGLIDPVTSSREPTNEGSGMAAEHPQAPQQAQSERGARQDGERGAAQDATGLRSRPILPRAGVTQSNKV